MRCRRALQSKYLRIFSYLFLAAMIFLVSSVSAVVPVATTNEGLNIWFLSSAEDESSNVNNHFGYITVESIHMNLEGTNAEVTVNYEIDPWMSFLVYLFGKQDLKERLLKIINYPENGSQKEQVVEFKYVDNNKAVIAISDAALSYGDNSYWYSAHSFKVEVPELIIRTPGGDKNYTNIREMDKGFGFFMR